MLGVLLSLRLVKAGIDQLLIKAEWMDLTEYGKQYLNLVKDGYRTNWWKLFNSLDVNIAIRVTSLIVSYAFNYGYHSLLVAEVSPFLKNHTVSLL